VSPTGALQCFVGADAAGEPGVLLRGGDFSASTYRQLREHLLRVDFRLSMTPPELLAQAVRRAPLRNG
jgi:hypothetical protein